MAHIRCVTTSLPDKVGKALLRNEAERLRKLALVAAWAE